MTKTKRTAKTSLYTHSNMQQDQQPPTQNPSPRRKRKSKIMSTLERPTTPPMNDEGDPSAGESSTSKRIKHEGSEPEQQRQQYHHHLYHQTSRTPAVESTYNTLLLLSVGPTAKSFWIHEGLLRKASPLFASALNTNTTIKDLLVPDNENKTLLLPNEDADVFTRVNRYLYSKNLLLDGEDLKALPWPALIDIYLFGTRFKITRLQNKCIDVTIHKHAMTQTVPQIETMNRIWGQDTNAAPLRQLFLHIYSRTCDLGSTLARTATGKFDKGFLKGLIMELYSMKESGQQGEGDGEKGVMWKGRKRWYVSDESNPFVLE